MTSKPRLKTHFLFQLAKFSLVGIVGFFVNAGLVSLSTTTIGPAFAQLLAFPLAATTTWLLNRRITFAASGRHPREEWARYVTANLLGWVANNGVYFALIFTVPLAHKFPVIAVAAGSIFGLAFNFSASRRHVFNQTKNE